MVCFDDLVPNTFSVTGPGGSNNINHPVDFKSDQENTKADNIF
jgi:hypothetical protein